MKLFIANSTRQHFRFYYRRPEHRDPLILEISSGGQIEFPIPISSRNDAEFILEQLHRYGARDASELADRLPGFSGLTYRFEKPVEIESLEQGDAAVMRNAEERSLEEVVKSVKRADLSNREKVGSRNERRLVQSTEVEIEQTLDPYHAQKDLIKTRLSVDEDGKLDKVLPRQ